MSGTSKLSLPPDWERLLAASRNARSMAYAPYSKYAVGAAVLTDDGQIFAGCNVENASYGLTVCAERVAVCSAVAAGFRKIAAVCVSLTGTPVPCGSCRQFLHEFNPQMIVLLDDLDQPAEDLPECVRLSDLLPRAFKLDSI